MHKGMSAFPPCPLCAKSGHGAPDSIDFVGARKHRGGTVRPSAFAVLRLITNSYLVGACTGKIGRFFAFEDAIDVASRAAAHVVEY